MTGGVSVERSRYSEAWREEPAAAGALEGDTLVTLSIINRLKKKTISASAVMDYLEIM